MGVLTGQHTVTLSRVLCNLRFRAPLHSLKAAAGDAKDISQITWVGLQIYPGPSTYLDIIKPSVGENTKAISRSLILGQTALLLSKLV